MRLFIAPLRHGTEGSQGCYFRASKLWSETGANLVPTNWCNTPGPLLLAPEAPSLGLQPFLGGVRGVSTGAILLPDPGARGIIGVNLPWHPWTMPSGINIVSAACRKTAPDVGAMKYKINAVWQKLDPNFVKRVCRGLRPWLEAMVGTRGGHIK